MLALGLLDQTSLLIVQIKLKFTRSKRSDSLILVPSDMTEKKDKLAVKEDLDPLEEYIADTLDPDDLRTLSVGKLSLLFHLQETQRREEFERNFKLRELEHKENLELAAKKAKDKKSAQESVISLIQSCFKMVVAAAALTIGTIFVFKGEKEVGYFLIGGGMSTVTTGVVGIMRNVRER